MKEKYKENYKDNFDMNDIFKLKKRKEPFSCWFNNTSELAQFYTNGEIPLKSFKSINDLIRYIEIGLPSNSLSYYNSILKHLNLDSLPSDISHNPKKLLLYLRKKALLEKVNSNL